MGKVSNLIASALSPRERVAEGRVRDDLPRQRPSSGASRHLLPGGEGHSLQLTHL
jgi:hypothetical protein